MKSLNEWIEYKKKNIVETQIIKEERLYDLIS